MPTSCLTLLVSVVAHCDPPCPAGERCLCFGSVCVPCLCDGDLDGNGTVDERDLELWYPCLGQRPEGDCAAADVNCDMFILGGWDHDWGIIMCQIAGGGPECCARCQSQADCEDGDPCNGIASCDGQCCVPGVPVDCNGNSIDDSCDINRETSADCNLNNVPDECECADGDGDGRTDLLELATLVHALTGPGLVADELARCSLDANDDGDLDLGDYASLQRCSTGP